MNKDLPQNPIRELKAIIFDIGRVIVRLDPERALGTIAAAAGGGRSGQQIRAELECDPRWDDWQEGKMEPREWHRHLTKSLDIPIDFKDFCDAWNRTLLPETILEDRLFARLGERYKLAVLSNTDPLHSALLEDEFPFLRYFPTRIYSCRVGASKPSTKIYQAALDRLDVSAAEALYIDDIEEFVVAARSLGMDAFRFENSSQFLMELARRGIPCD